jgi:hypothetical protein
MGICYINKNPKQVVMNLKLTADQTKSDNFPKSKLLLIKTGQLIIFKHRIRQIYYTNSLRQIALSDYMKIVRESKTEKNIEKKIVHLLSRLSLKILEEGILRDIITFSNSKLSLIFPKTKKFKLICKMIYFFFSKKNDEINKKRKKFLNKIINYSRISFNDDYFNEQNESMVKNMVKASIFSTNKLTLIIINIILCMSFIALYYFVTPTVFEIFFNFTEKKLEELLVEKKEVDDIKQKDIEEIVLHIMKMINPSFSRNLFLCHAIYNICCPLKKYIINHPTQKIFELDKDNNKYFDEFMQKIDEMFNLETILEIMYSNEPKEV